jgi:hypothetical protein
MNKWAILIGPTEYEHVRPLKYCTKDIVDVGEALRKTLEFPGENILAFGTGLQHKPGLTEFYHELGEFLRGGRIQENDLVFFYFSGHGIRDKKDYLLPVDATPTNLSRTGIEVEDLVNQLTETHCKNIVMFIDACREAIRGQKGINAIGEDSKGIVERKGIVTFFSCDPEDLSYEIEELQHGSFTYCFLEAIKSRKCFTAAEVYDFLIKEVPLTNKRYKKPPQRPYAVIVPEDKRDLQLLYSSVYAVESTRQLEALTRQLGDLYPGFSIEMLRYFDMAVDLLAVAKERQLIEDEAMKLELIERLCTGKLKPTSFAVAWDAIERRRGQGWLVTGARQNLEPLL